MTAPGLATLPTEGRWDAARWDGDPAQLLAGVWDGGLPAGVIIPLLPPQGTLRRSSTASLVRADDFPLKRGASASLVRADDFPLKRAASPKLVRDD